jgi:RNA-directed DNA polymerase
VGDQRLISLIRRWVKAGALEKGEVHLDEEGTPQGRSISVLLSNLYLHYVLDPWFERVVKPRLRGEACMVRYIDDFVLCFQYRADALRVQETLANRLRRFNLTLEPAKTKLVEFGRYAQRHVGKRGRKRPERRSTFWVLPCTARAIGKETFGSACVPRNRPCVALLMSLQEQMRLMRHSSLPEQVHHLNQMLRGHDAYYGIAGNLRSLLKVHRAVERYWRKILSSRGAGTARSLGSNSNGSSRSSRCLNRSSTSLTRSCRPSPNCESTSDEPSSGNPHAGFCGAGGG